MPNFSVQGDRSFPAEGISQKIKKHVPQKVSWREGEGHFGFVFQNFPSRVNYPLWWFLLVIDFGDLLRLPKKMKSIPQKSVLGLNLAIHFPATCFRKEKKLFQISIHEPEG